MKSGPRPRSCSWFAAGPSPPGDLNGADETFHLYLAVDSERPTVSGPCLSTIRGKVETTLDQYHSGTQAHKKYPRLWSVV